jgi:hypothetical protein
VKAVDDAAIPALTIFATPKAFTGTAAVNQRNAVWSWAQLGPEVEVILIGDEEGVEDASKALGTRHVGPVERSPQGVPLLNDVWRIGQREARADWCLFVNADIILGPDVLETIVRMKNWAKQMLLVGQRWDAEIEGLVEARGPAWWAETKALALSRGRLDSFLWIDYFAFPRGQYPDLPPFVIGRPGYDNWLVWHTRARAIPVVDTSLAITAIHQHHTYAQYGGSKIHVWTDDAQRNADLIGDRRRLYTIGHATHRLDGRGVVPARGAKYTLARIYTRARPAIDSTANVRHRMGLDAELVQRLATPLRRRQQRRAE